MKKRNDIALEFMIDGIHLGLFVGPIAWCVIFLFFSRFSISNLEALGFLICTLFPAAFFGAVVGAMTGLIMGQVLVQFDYENLSETTFRSILLITSMITIFLISITILFIIVEVYATPIFLISIILAFMAGLASQIMASKFLEKHST